MLHCAYFLRQVSIIPVLSAVGLLFVAVSASAQAGNDIPDSVRTMVFEEGEFAESIACSYADMSEAYDQAKEGNLWALARAPKPTRRQPLVGYFLSHDLGSLEEYTNQATDRVGRRLGDKHYFWVWTDKALRLSTGHRGDMVELTWGERELQSIDYVNRYEATVFGVKVPTVAFRFTYQVEGSMPELEDLEQAFEGRAKGYLDPDDGRWKLENVTLEDAGCKEFEDSIRGRYARFDLSWPEFTKTVLQDYENDRSRSWNLVLKVGNSSTGEKPNEDDIDQVLQMVQQRVRSHGVRVLEREQISENRISLNLAGISDWERTRKVVSKRGLLTFNMVKRGEAFRDALPRIDRAIVQELGPENLAAPSPRPLSSLLLESGTGGIFLVREKDVPTVRGYLGVEAVRDVLPRNTLLLWGSTPVAQGEDSYRELYVLEEEPLITGEYLADAGPARRHPTSNRLVVPFEMNRRGARILERGTSRHINEQMAIVLDTLVQSAPVIRKAIGRRAQIELGSSATREDAEDFALLLRVGPLPLPVTVLAELQN